MHITCEEDNGKEKLECIYIMCEDMAVCQGYRRADTSASCT